MSHPLFRRLAALAIVSLAAHAAADAAPGRPPGEGRTLSTDGVTIWYEVLGTAEGRPLVVVNGGPGFDHAYLRVSDVWDRLAERRPVVVYDQRGNGRSGAIPEGRSCTLPDQVADLDALRAELGYERIDLLGHSWGGYLVMAYAIRHPERVNRLVIASSAAPKWSDTEFLFESIYPEGMARWSRLDALEAVGDATAAGKWLREYLGMLCVSPEKTAELLERSGGFVYTKAINETLNAELASRDLWPALSGLTMPTLVATGRFDINVSPRTAWKIHEAIPGSRFVVFERSGHLPFFEEPEAWVETIEAFLR